MQGQMGRSIESGNDASRQSKTQIGFAQFEGHDKTGP